jgi:hypothetical protein
MADFPEGLNGAAMMVRGPTVLVEAAGGLADVESAVPCTVEASFQTVHHLLSHAGCARARGRITPASARRVTASRASHPEDAR